MVQCGRHEGWCLLYSRPTKAHKKSDSSTKHENPKFKNPISRKLPNSWLLEQSNHQKKRDCYISTYLLGRHNIIISVDVGMKMDGSLEANHKIMDDIIFDDDRSVSDVGVDFFDWEQIVREAEENGEDDDSDISFDMEGVEEVPTDDEFEYDSDWDSIESIEMKPKGYKPANVPPPIQ